MFSKNKKSYILLHDNLYNLRNWYKAENKEKISNHVIGPT